MRVGWERQSPESRSQRGPLWVSGRADRFASRPDRGVLREARALHSDDAEALTGRRFHHDPALQAAHHLRAQGREPRHFRGDVVSLDIDMDATVVLDPLDFDDRLIQRRRQHAVVTATAGMREVRRATQRLAPEAGGAVNIGSLAIYEQSAQSRAVHERTSRYHGNDLAVACAVPAPRQSLPAFPWRAPSRSDSHAADEGSTGLQAQRRAGGG